MANISQVPVKKDDKTQSLSSHSLTWPLDTLRREVDRLFEDFRHGSGRGVFDMEPFWRGGLSFGKSPAVDVAEKDKRYEVTAELPGLTDKDIAVKYADGVLTISGEKKEEKEEKKKNVHRVERFAGAFYRAIQLPPGADPEKVNATSANGVITVAIPKKLEAQPKKITVTPKA